MSYLRRLPIDKIKIDKSFIDDIHRDPSQSVLVEAMIKVAHSLNITVVAEGVESKEQLDALRVLNCDAWQGYHLSPAVPADEIGGLLSSSAVLRHSRAITPVEQAR